MCVRTHRSASLRVSHLPRAGDFFQLSLTFLMWFLIPGSFVRGLFSSRRETYGKALQERRAEESTSAGGRRRISCSRPGRGLPELVLASVTQGTSQEIGVGWRLHHRPGVGVTGLVQRSAEQHPHQPPDTEGDVHLLPCLAR